MSLNDKRISVLVYDNTGAFITTFRDDEMSTRPNWRENINGGLSQVTLSMHGDRFRFDDFGRTTYCQHMNIVRIFVFDNAHPDGREMFTGYIAKRSPYLKRSGQGVMLEVNHVSAILQADKYNNGGSPPVFSVSHSGEDPEDVFRAIVDNWQTVFGDPDNIGPLIRYDASTTDPVGTNVTKEFVEKTHYEALKDAAELAGEGWFWKIDGPGKAWLKEKPATATHTFTVDLDIDDIDAPESAEEIVNYVRVKRTGGTEANYQDATSQETYGFGSPTPTGRWTKIVNDSTIGDATTSDQRGGKELGEGKDAKIRAVITVNSVYDIESIHVGETCKIANLHVDNDFFNDNMLIGAVDYDGDTAKVSIIEDPMNFADELEKFVAAA